MAERRMFAKTIIDSDAFLDMPLSAQALYMHLSMRADDEGFINNPKRIQKTIGCAEDDMKLLIAKSFIIPFESGVVVIKHWRINNYIQKDRFKPTAYTEEKATLHLKENGAYTKRIQDGYSLDTQYSIGKVSIGKYSIDAANYKDKSNEIKRVRERLERYANKDLIQQIYGSTDLIDEVINALADGYENGNDEGRQLIEQKAFEKDIQQRLALVVGRLANKTDIVDRKKYIIAVFSQAATEEEL